MTKPSYLLEARERKAWGRKLRLTLPNLACLRLYASVSSAPGQGYYFLGRTGRDTQGERKLGWRSSGTGSGTGSWVGWG